MSQKVYKKSAILAAIEAKVAEVIGTHNRAIETVQKKLAEKLAVYTAQFVESGLTHTPAPLCETIQIPSQGYVEQLKMKSVELEALADVEGEDSCLLDESYALTLLTPGAFPQRQVTFHIGA